MNDETSQKGCERGLEGDGKEDTFSHLFVFAGSNKAGMEDSDKAKQAKVIYEMSKGSRFFSHANRQDSKRQEKIQNTKERLTDMPESKIRELTPKIEQEIVRLETARNIEKVCVVFDMDMFFAAVAIRDRPYLVNKPVAIGDMGMISTTNYVARKYGVRSAMPGFIGKRLCPDLVFVPSEFEKYKEASAIVKRIISEYDPHLESFSLDEFFVDLTSISHNRLEQKRGVAIDNISETCVFELRDVACEVVSEIRGRIEKTTGGLTSSAGIAHNFMLAKIAADINKPNGQFSLPPSRTAVVEFVEALPCRKVGGIGKVTEKVLSDLGMHTMGEVRRNLPKIVLGFTPSQAKFLMRASLGISREELSAIGEVEERKRLPEVAGGQKSIGVERTFSALRETAELMHKLSEICQKLSKELEQKGIWAGTITLKLKTVTFEVMTRRHTLDKSVFGDKSITAGPIHRYIQNKDDVFNVASALLRGCLPVHIRLMGVQASKLRLSATGRTSVANIWETPLGRLLQRRGQGGGSVGGTASILRVEEEILDGGGDDKASDSEGGWERGRSDGRDYKDECSNDSGGNDGYSGGSDVMCLLQRDSGSTSSQHNDGTYRSTPFEFAMSDGRSGGDGVCDSEITPGTCSRYCESVSSKDEQSSVGEDSSWGWETVEARVGVDSELTNQWVWGSDGTWHDGPQSSYDSSGCVASVLNSRVSSGDDAPSDCTDVICHGGTATGVECREGDPDIYSAYSCPVCGDDSSKSLMLLNRHLDICLVMSSKKRKGILNYFHREESSGGEGSGRTSWRSRKRSKCT